MLDTLLRMRIFAAVYEEASFTGAAMRENVTQSGVTQHVQKLEDYFDVQLFVRRGGRVLPTAAADAYYNACIRVLRTHQDSRSALLSCRGELSGEVVVGLTPVLTRAVLGPTLTAYMREHPNVRVKIIEAEDGTILHKVRTGGLDFGIVQGGPWNPNAMRRELFVRTPEFLVSGQCGVRIGNVGPLRPGNAGPLNLVVPSADHPRRLAIEDYLSRTGMVVTQRMEIDSAHSTLDFVAHSNWVTFLPAALVLREMGDAGFVVHPLLDPDLQLNLYRVERMDDPISAAAAKFGAALNLHATVVAARARKWESEPNAEIGS